MKREEAVAITCLLQQIEDYEALLDEFENLNIVQIICDSYIGGKDFIENVSNIIKDKINYLLKELESK